MGQIFDRKFVTPKIFVFNVAKTQSMLVSTKAKRKALDKSNQNLQVKINGTELRVVSTIKYLRVLLNNSLDWKDQVWAVSLKVSRGLGILKHAKKFLQHSALRSLYTSNVEPHFRYCCPVWGCAGTTEINRLQKLQKMAARIVTKSSFDNPSNQLIENLGWKTINELINIESKTIVLESLTEFAPPYLRSLLWKNSQSTSHRLRNTSTDIRLPQQRKENCKKSFSFRGTRLCNSLSAKCKQAATLSTFKHHISLQNECGSFTPSFFSSFFKLCNSLSANREFMIHDAPYQDALWRSGASAIKGVPSTHWRTY